MRKKKQIAWIVVLSVLAIAGGVGIQTFNQFAEMETDARDACSAYLEKAAGNEIDVARLSTSGIDVVFPKRFDKRFRTTCTYGDVTVRLEAKPLRSWRVVAAEGLD